jgi:hypothetical protein
MPARVSRRKETTVSDEREKIDDDEANEATEDEDFEGHMLASPADLDKGRSPADLGPADLGPADLGPADL